MSPRLRIALLVGAALLPLSAKAQTQTPDQPPASSQPFGVPPEVRAPTQEEQAQLTQLMDRASRYQSAGSHSNALQTIAELKALLVQTWGPRHPLTATADALAAQSMASLGRYGEAEKSFASSVAALQARLGGDDPTVTTFTMARAANLIAWGQPGRAEPLLVPLEPVVSKRSGQDSLERASVLANLAWLRQVQGQFSEAQRLAEQALRIRQARLPAGSPLIDNIQARIASLLVATGRYPEAAAAIGDRDGPRDGETIGTARLSEVRGDLLFAQARYKDAEAAYLRAGTIYLATAGYDAPDTLTASAKWRIAWQKTRELPAGVPPDSKLPFLPAIHCDKPPASLAEVWESRVAAEDLAPDDAVRCRRLIQDFLQANYGPSNPETILAGQQLAEALNRVGSTEEAETLANEVLAGQTSRLGPDHPQTMATALLLGDILAAQGRTEEADALYARGLRGPGDAPLRALIGQASLLDSRGEFVKADGYWQRAFGAVQGLDQDMPLLTRLIGGSIFNQTMRGQCPKDLHEALAHLIELKRGANPWSNMLIPDDPIEEAWAQSLACQGQWKEAAELYQKMGRAQMGKVGSDFYLWYRNAALLDARRALTLSASPSTLDDSLEAASEAMLIARNRHFTREWDGNKAVGKRRLPSDEGASDPLAIAFVSALKANWAGILRDWKGQAPMDQTSAASGATLNRLTGLGYGWTAFKAAQDLGLSTAAQALLEAAARDTIRDPALEQLVRQQQALVGELQEQERKQFAADGRIDPASLSRLKQGKAQLDALNEKIRTGFPAYAELVRPAAIDVRRIQERLKPGEGLLYIQPAWNDLYVFAVSRDRFTWKKVGVGVGELDERVRKLRCVLDGVSCHLGENSSGPFDTAAAFGLYRDVVAPVEPALEGCDQLFVVASGSLGGLPLGLLRTDASGSSGWLADKYAMVTLPSVSSLRALPRNEGGGTAAFTGFGDPLLGPPEDADPTEAIVQTAAAKTSRGPGALADVSSVRALPSLPYTRRELLHMASALHVPESSLQLGEAATEAAVKSSRAVRDSKILVFATHGLLPRDINGLTEPGLVFTPPAKATAEDDGILTASETAKLTLSADWVVLSACNTAASDGSVGGESLSGLARSFLYAGAHALLASHWQVSDQATATLTVETMRAARAHPEWSRAKALQAAMRAVRSGTSFDGSKIADWQSDWADPWYWAPFVLIETGS